MLEEENLPKWIDFAYLLSFGSLILSCSFSGESCISPGNITHGQWTCSTQELPIPDATFLDGGAKTYKGEFADNAIIVIFIIC